MIKKNSSSNVVINVIFIIIAAMCLIPVLLIVISSLTDEHTLLLNGYSFFPEKFNTYAYEYIFKGGGGTQILHGYFISVIVTVLGTAVSLVFTVLFAYPLSRKDLPFRRVFSFVVFFTMLFNGGLVPSYMMWTQIFNIKNTMWALILPNLLMTAFYVIMVKNYFTNNIPNAILEAARIDGAGELCTLLRIVLPLSKPIIATVGFMTALTYWNDWLNGLYYVSDSQYFSIQNILNRMMLDVQFLSSSDIGTVGNAASQLPSTGIRMAVAVLGLLPILAAYPFFQKYFVKGIALGGVKE